MNLSHSPRRPVRRSRRHAARPVRGHRHERLVAQRLLPPGPAAGHRLALPLRGAAQGPLALHRAERDQPGRSPASRTSRSPRGPLGAYMRKQFDDPEAVIAARVQAGEGDHARGVRQALRRRSRPPPAREAVAKETRRPGEPAAQEAVKARAADERIRPGRGRRQPKRSRRRPRTDAEKEAGRRTDAVALRQDAEEARRDRSRTSAATLITAAKATVRPLGVRRGRPGHQGQGRQRRRQADRPAAAGAPGVAEAERDRGGRAPARHRLGQRLRHRGQEGRPTCGPTCWPPRPTWPRTPTPSSPS